MAISQWFILVLWCLIYSQKIFCCSCLLSAAITTTPMTILFHIRLCLLVCYQTCGGIVSWTIGSYLISWLHFILRSPFRNTGLSIYCFINLDGCFKQSLSPPDIWPLNAFMVYSNHKWSYMISGLRICFTYTSINHVRTEIVLVSWNYILEYYH